MPELTITLSDTPGFTRRFVQVTFVLLETAGATAIGVFAGSRIGLPWQCGVAGAVLGLAVAIAFVRRLDGGSPPRSVSVVATHLRVQRKNGRVISIPLRDVRAVVHHMRWPKALIITSNRHNVVLPRAALAADDPDVLRQAIRTAVASQPNGTEQFAAMERREDVAKILIHRRPWLTFGLAGLIGVVFLLEGAQGAFNSPEKLLSLGANAPGLIASGQWWRLFTANFLHGSFVHFFVNYFALGILGASLERLVGITRMLAIALIAGLAGGVASALGSTGVLSVGASTILFGMIGAIVVAVWRSRELLPGTMRWGALAVVLGLNLLISMIPGVDGWGHLGGLLGGIAAAWALVPRDPRTRPDITARAVCAVLLVAYLVAGATAVANFKRVSPDDFLDAALRNERLAPVALNSIAWKYATNPFATEHQLSILALVTPRLVEKEPHNAQYRDTYAYVLHRTGQNDQALAEERVALGDVESDKSKSGLYTMLLRFLKERGPLNPSPAIVRCAGGNVEIESDIAGAAIFAGDPDRGLVRIILPAGVREARAAISMDAGDGTLPVWLIDPAGPERRTSSVQVSFAPREPAVAYLP